MQGASVEVRPPQRWDTPFGESPLPASDVEWALSVPPFDGIDEARFPSSTPLREILRHDARIVRSIAGDVVLRAGDYGTSTFFILAGRLRVVLESSSPGISAEIQGNAVHERPGLLPYLAQLWRAPRIPEFRDYDQSAVDDRVLSEGLFLADVPAVLDRHRTALLEPGEFFGELSALGRAPRTATVFAETEAALLEMRWQGLREIRRRAPEIQRHIDALYRERSLKEHFRATPIFRHLDDQQLERVAEETIFDSFGDLDWAGSYKNLAKEGREGLLRREPVVVEQGHYPNGLILIRSGFGRVSVHVGEDHPTVRYLGRGQMFGYEEIVENWRSAKPSAYRSSLRAVGYLDTLLVPTRVLEEIVLPGLPEELLPAPESDATAAAGRTPDADVPTDVLEHLVDGRYINGTATMLIDLERCTHCDDCVRACAATHGGNPRFVRHGETIGRFLIANACMHCVDPVCMIGCPTGAIHRVAIDGQVAINDDTCIGCGTCANNCPYDNIRMVEVRDRGGAIMVDERTRTPILKATKCDLCVDQLVSPACQNACPHDALKRVDMRDTAQVAGLFRR